MNLKLYFFYPSYPNATLEAGVLNASWYVLRTSKASYLIALEEYSKCVEKKHILFMAEGHVQVASTPATLLGC